MSGLVSCHLVNGVMDSVEVVLLGELSKVELALGSAVFTVDSPLEVLFGAGGHIGLELGAEELCELCSVLCFFESSLFPVKSDLRISFSVSDACHAKIHTYFGALTLEIGLELVDDILLVFFVVYSIEVHTYAEYVLSCKSSALFHYLELGSGALAERANISFGDGFAFIHITANGAYKFFHFIISLKLK